MIIKSRLPIVRLGNRSPNRISLNNIPQAEYRASSVDLQEDIFGQAIDLCNKTGQDQTEINLPIAQVPFNLGRLQSRQSHEKELQMLINYKRQNYDNSFEPSRSFNQGLIKYERVSSVSFRTPDKNNRSLSRQNNRYTTRSYLRGRPPSATPFASRMQYNPSNSPFKKYRGDFLYGKKHGMGKLVYLNGDQYKGTMMDNKKNGQGTFVYTDLNVKYNGYWENGKRHGNGTIIFSNGDEVQIEWNMGYPIASFGVLKTKQGIYNGYITQKLERDQQGDMIYENGVKYSGQWLDDKRHGKGELNNHEMQFIGQFTQDYINGKGIMIHKKVLNLTKPSKFQNQKTNYILGLKRSMSEIDQQATDFNSIWTNLKVKDLSKQVQQNLKHDGIFLSGYLQGQPTIRAGCQRLGNFAFYQGNFEKGQKSGFGQMKYVDLERICINIPEYEGEYIGNWIKDKRHGFGIMKWATGYQYEGQFKYDQRHKVEGKLIFPTGDLYQGGWRHNKIHGQGKFISKQGLVYQGKFRNGYPTDQGKIDFPNGEKYEGQMTHFVPHGKGILKTINQTVLKGNFFDGILNGLAEINYPNGDKYIGQVQDGVIDGQGIMQYAVDGTKYEGNWRQGVKEGYGMLFDKKGVEIFIGNWRNDQYDGPGEILCQFSQIIQMEDTGDESLTDMLIRKEKELQNLAKLRIQQLQEQLQYKDSIISQLQTQIKRITEDFNFNLQVIQERDREIQDLEQQITQLTKSQGYSSNFEYTQTSQEFEQQKQQSDQHIKDLRQELTELKYQHERTMKIKDYEITELRKALQDKSGQDNTQQLEFEVQQLKSQNNRMKYELEQERIRCKELQESLEDAKNQYYRDIQDIEYQTNYSENKIGEIQAKYDKIIVGKDQQIKDLQIQMNSIKNNNEDRARLSLLQDKLSQMQNEAKHKQDCINNLECEVSILSEKLHQTKKFSEECKTKVSYTESELKFAQEQAKQWQQISEKRSEDCQQSYKDKLLAQEEIKQLQHQIEYIKNDLNYQISQSRQEGYREGLRQAEQQVRQLETDNTRLTQQITHNISRADTPGTFVSNHEDQRLKTNESRCMHCSFTQYATLQAENERLSDQVELKSREVQRLQAIVNSIRTDLQNTQKERDGMKEILINRSIYSQVANQSEEIGQKQQESKESSLKAFKDEIQDLKYQIEDLKCTNQGLKKENKGLQQDKQRFAQVQQSFKSTPRKPFHSSRSVARTRKSEAEQQTDEQPRLRQWRDNGLRQRVQAMKENLDEKFKNATQILTKRVR